MEQVSIPLKQIARPPSRHLPLTEEDQARADFYALIAALLLKAPEPELLAALATADPLPSAQHGHALATSWAALVHAAACTSAAEVREEFDALFIAIGSPLLNPYGSRYLTGFMMEKPLAHLRDDLRALGLGRSAGSSEAEDHLGALCEAMRVLIGGTHGALRKPPAVQQAFFMRHLAPWYERCLDDIREAAPARFYRELARFAKAFLEVECEAYAIEDGSGGSDLLLNESTSRGNAQ